MKETNTNMNQLPKEKLKERMNFAKMFERQGQQIKQTSHITNLLNPQEEVTTKEAPSHEIKSRLEKLEDHYNMNTIEQRFDLLEEKIGERISELKEQKKFNIKFELKNRRHAYFIGATAIVSALIFGIMLRPDTKVEVKEKVVFKEQPAKVLYAMTKFVNIRERAATSSKKITTLSPNSVVEILDQKNGWKKILYKDHINGKTIKGWAYGENLKKIKK